MVNRNTISALVLMTMFSITTLAQSQEPEPVNYVLIKVGETNFEESFPHFASMFRNNFGVTADITKLDFDMPDKSLKITEGFRFGKYLALEGSASFFGNGDVIATTVVPDIEGNPFEQTHRISSQYYGAELHLVGNLQFLKTWTIYGKGGGIYWRAEHDMEDPIEGQDTKRTKNQGSPSLGVGLRKDLGNLVIDLSWSSTEVDKLYLEEINLGLGFRY